MSDPLADLVDRLGMRQKFELWKQQHTERECSPTGRLTDCECTCADHGCYDLVHQPYTCTKCKDTGYIQAMKRSPEFKLASTHYSGTPCDWCSAGEQERRDAFRRLCSTVPPHWFEKYRMELLPASSHVRQFTEKWFHLYQERPVLLISGPHGNGKTHVSVAAVEHFLRRGMTAYWTTALDYLEAIKATWGDEKADAAIEIVRPAKAAHLLVIDEMGLADSTEWANAKMYEVINYRYMNDLPMLITTNLLPEELPDARIRSRITGASNTMICRIPMDSPDYRRVERD